MVTLSIENFAIPGDAGFALAGVLTNPKDRSESEAFRSYFTQLRAETGVRLVELAYKSDGSPNKWWMCFSKKKFMQKSLDPNAK